MEFIQLKIKCGFICARRALASSSNKQYYKTWSGRINECAVYLSCCTAMFICSPIIWLLSQHVRWRKRSKIDIFRFIIDSLFFISSLHCIMKKLRETNKCEWWSCKGNGCYITSRSWRLIKIFSTYCTCKIQTLSRNSDWVKTIS